MKKISTVLVICILLVSQGYSQKAPIKFGKINKKDLEMQTCIIDSTAPAVILCDYGYFNGNTFQFTRIMRIKILKKSGRGWGDWVINTRWKANVKGITYNLENGEIEKEKLKNSSIFNEIVYENRNRLRLSMPNVKVGSVIDIQWTYPGLPKDWYFQQRIPVLRSELIVENSTYISFRKNFFGYVPLNEASQNRWVALNVPAFNEEPYMSSPENYISKFEFDLKKVSFPGLYINFSGDWNGVSHTLFDMSYFGVPIKATNMFLKGMAKEISKKNVTDKQKVIAALDTLHSIKWNGDEWLFTTEKEKLNTGKALVTQPILTWDWLFCYVN